MFFLALIRNICPSYVLFVYSYLLHLPIYTWLNKWACLPSLPRHPTHGKNRNNYDEHLYDLWKKIKIKKGYFVMFLLDDSYYLLNIRLIEIVLINTFFLFFSSCWSLWSWDSPGVLCPQRLQEIRMYANDIINNGRKYSTTTRDTLKYNKIWLILGLKSNHNFYWFFDISFWTENIIQEVDPILRWFEHYL